MIKTNDMRGPGSAVTYVWFSYPVETWPSRVPKQQDKSGNPEVDRNLPSFPQDKSTNNASLWPKLSHHLFLHRLTPI